MSKSLLRSKYINLRKTKNQKDVKINLLKVLRLFKNFDYTKKIFGGYYPINYEKMQVYEDGREANLNMLCDADMLIHPHLPDLQEIVKDPAYVAFNDNYNISEKYQTNRIPYFVRDGRDVGIATNFVVTSNLTHDLWEPLSLSPQQICD